MFIYLMEDAHNGELKIGITKDYMERLRSLKCGRPNISLVAYRLLKSKQSAQAVERALHKRYAHLNIGGEWFKPSEDIKSFFVDKLKSRRLSELPASPKPGKPKKKRKPASTAHVPVWRSNLRGYPGTPPIITDKWGRLMN